MTRVKRFTAMIAAMTLVLSLLTVQAGAASSVPDELREDYEYAAELLSSLGLFKGTDNGFELDRVPTRTEASVMLIRLLGKETEALASTATHPFTDVAKWADRYIAYMYDAGLTKGVSEDKFGSDSDCTAEMFATFVLRSLDYSEDNGDFTYKNSLSAARLEGLITSDYMLYLQDYAFIRGDMALFSASALLMYVKDTDTLMIERLIGEGAVEEKAAGELLDMLHAVAALAYASYKDYENGSYNETEAETITYSEDGYQPGTLKISSVQQGTDLFTDNPKICAVHTYTVLSGAQLEYAVYLKDGYLYYRYLDGTTDKLNYAEYAKEFQDSADSITGGSSKTYSNLRALSDYEGITYAQSGNRTVITYKYTDADANALALDYVNLVVEGVDEFTDNHIVNVKNAEATYTLLEDGRYDSYTMYFEFEYMNLSDGVKITISASVNRTYIDSGVPPTITFPDLSGF